MPFLGILAALPAVLAKALGIQMLLGSTLLFRRAMLPLGPNQCSLMTTYNFSCQSLVFTSMDEPIWIYHSRLLLGTKPSFSSAMDKQVPHRQVIIIEPTMPVFTPMVISRTITAWLAKAGISVCGLRTGCSCMWVAALIGVGLKPWYLGALAQHPYSISVPKIEVPKHAVNTSVSPCSSSIRVIYHYRGCP